MMMRWGEREGWRIPIPSPPWCSNFTACYQNSHIHNMNRSSNCVRVESSGVRYNQVVPYAENRFDARKLALLVFCFVGIVDQAQFVATQHVYEQSLSLAPTNGKNTINKRNSFVAGSVQRAGATRSSHAMREKKSDAA